MATIAESLALAVQHHQAGRLAEAEKIYLQLLQANPSHPDALHLLGVIANQRGRPEQAISYIRQAIRAQPSNAAFYSDLGNALRDQGKLDEAVACYRQALGFKVGYAEAHNNLGVSLRQQGKQDEAIACYRTALKLKPEYAEAHNNLGNALRQQGKLDEAVACYRRALGLKPDYAAAHNNLGKALRNQGKLDEAIACYRTALELKPGYAEAHNNLGNALRDQGRLDEAVTSYRHVLGLKPNYAEAHHNLGVALREQGKRDEAVAANQRALKLKPDFAEAHNNLGNALGDQGKRNEAVAAYRRALELKPDFAEAHNNLGNVLGDQGKLDEAVASYRRALELKPDFAEAHNNLGNVLKNQGKLDEALAGYRRALELKPDYAEAHWNLSLYMLLQGDLEHGWPEYEWRWQRKKMPSFAAPLWDGSDLSGRTILLHSEQGLGDMLQFIRYATMVKQRGGRVIAACPPALLPILASCSGIDQLVPQQGSLPAFDVHLPLMSLPRIFGTTLDSIPATVPYLSADPALVEQWGRQLARLRGVKIGIGWQGNPQFRYDRQRSIPLNCFESIARIENVHLISLQKGPGADQVAGVDFPVTDFSARLDEVSGAFMDTAAVIRNLDLVITSDSAVAHLAGAVGAPVWLALPRIPDWRWLLNREDSPWYPTMRLFRQTERDNWRQVFTRIAAEVRNLEFALARQVAVSPNGEGSSSSLIRIPVSAGELIDKITILEIKRERLEDAGKRANVLRELELLKRVQNESIPPSEELAGLYTALKCVNVRLWDIENEIRECDGNESNRERFIELARAVYQTNDRRSIVKRQINELLRSPLIEEKSYGSCK